LAGEGKKEEKGNAKAQSRREENEKDFVISCRGMGILPMIPTGVQCCHLCNAAPPWRGSPEGVPRGTRGGGRMSSRGTRDKMPAVQWRLGVVCGLCGSSLSRP